MSNALVSKQLTVSTLPDDQIVQLDAIMSRSDSIVPNILEGSTEPLNYNLETQQQPLYNKQDCVMSSYPAYLPPLDMERLMWYNRNGQSESMPNNVNVQKFTLLGHAVGHKPGGHPISGQPRLSMPNKRKMSADPSHVYQGPQKMSVVNKRVTQLGSYGKSPIVVEESAPNKKSVQTFVKGAASGRKVLQIEAETKKNVQPQVSPKSQTESYDSVRAKLRDSLASALALVLQEREGDKTKNEEAVVTSKEGVSGSESAASASSTTLEPRNGEGSHASDIPVSTDGSSDVKQSSSAALTEEISEEASQKTVLQGEEPMYSSDFYFKDEFLMGNGLTWVSGFNSLNPDMKDCDFVIQPEPVHEHLTSAKENKKVQSPESLAFEIELELFKLFDGVNKKYKEKGRSLLFNLKDRNNPELREQVMSGAIPPDRLCSMSAEELASKELSQWRIAKAEELDNMKVLPDEGNVRLLVKKNHKGEYQVDFDHDVGVSEDMPAGSSVPPPSQYEIHKSNAAAPKKTEKSTAAQCEITLPSDGDDMQGLMVDYVKDLPPVISLDEFMESLNKEPPFESLPVDSATIMAEPDHKNVRIGSKSMSPVESPLKLAHIVSKENLDGNVQSPKTDALQKPIESPKVSKPDIAVQLPKSDSVWEGELQVNLSSTVNFVAFYKSGEKASTREWSMYFEIKGRVKLDAFDKFLQALPMSRSRAVMVCHFALKEGFVDSERASLLELADSYIADERLGFAEPAHGVELYLCPPRTKTVDMIINRLPKSYTDKLNDIDDGLIGIVVWRKVQISSSVMSPVSSSQHKNVTNKQSRNEYVQNDVKHNNVLASRSVPPPSPLSKSQPADGEDDELPPGFGPPGSRDDDDLPEFQFSGGSQLSAIPVAKMNPAAHSPGIRFQNHTRAPPQQVEQMRKLIQQYGQSGNDSRGVPIEPWNDDDDDIPEWQPQAPHYPQTPQLQPAHFTNYQPYTHATFQHPHWPSVAQPLQPPMGVQQRPAWNPYGPNGVEGLPNGQFYEAPGPVSGHVVRDWRSSAPRDQNV